ncbi:MAG: 5'-nucleotidase surE [Candidatus Xenolissoclinum pacificiensis L6]|uniref:5'-nucleotidase n=1 Tax=Candidatus Xenolissoclinum pacificiensis L6 TaxID=1401685 RepID=W2V2Q1_9RICK|nr:MAG: 5'-nucleotidase surE [Candidatus Xenolissoclinum pacificiensis L6]
MIVLLTNDDGFESSGLLCIKNYLQKNSNIKKVYVFSPNEDRSAQGHAVTMGLPIEYSCKGEDFYAVQGTTVDCVLFGLYMMPVIPDLVVSGINLGANIGLDSNYSSTLSGALEGVMNNIPSISLSQFYLSEKKSIEFHIQNKIFEDFFSLYLKHTSLFNDIALNVNFPCFQPKGLKIVTDNMYKTKAKVDLYEEDEYFIFEKNSFNYDSRELHRHPMYNGFVTVTPVKPRAYSSEYDIKNIEYLVSMIR